MATTARRRAARRRPECREETMTGTFRPGPDACRPARFSPSVRFTLLAREAVLPGAAVTAVDHAHGHRLAVGGHAPSATGPLRRATAGWRHRRAISALPQRPNHQGSLAAAARGAGAEAVDGTDHRAAARIGHWLDRHRRAEGLPRAPACRSHRERARSRDDPGSRPARRRNTRHSPHHEDPRAQRQRAEATQACVSGWLRRMRNLTKSRPASLFEPSQEGGWHGLRLAPRDDVDPGRLFQPFNAHRGHELKEVELHPQPGSIVIRDRA